MTRTLLRKFPPIHHSITYEPKFDLHFPELCSNFWKSRFRVLRTSGVISLGLEVEDQVYLFAIKFPLTLKLFWFPNRLHSKVFVFTLQWIGNLRKQCWQTKHGKHKNILPNLKPLHENKTSSPTFFKHLSDRNFCPFNKCTFTSEWFLRSCRIIDCTFLLKSRESIPNKYNPSVKVHTCYHPQT